MRNPVGINMKKDEIVIRISEGAEQKEIVECLNKKIPALKKLYKTEKTPILVTGKVLKNKEINEIIMVKLGDMEQSTDILLKFVDRLTKLKDEYAQNEDIQKILNSQESLVMKQQAGIAVMIISPKAADIEAKFDEVFK